MNDVDIIKLYILYLQTVGNIKEYGDTYGDESTLTALERELNDLTPDDSAIRLKLRKINKS